MVGIASASLRLALAAWLLLTNLSLGLYHCHEADDQPAPSKAHRAAPEAWHYHVLVLGVELDFLSLNSEDCPFRPAGSTDPETHVLLATLLDPGTNHEPGPSPALTLAAVPLCLPSDCLAHDVQAQATAILSDGRTGLPPPPSVLGVRSGVQQI